ncbi:MAG: DNA polymerase III subunit epsilon [Pseudomonadota bacterium]
MTEVLREIAFDTETTGLDPRNGDRVVELGAVEMVNHVATDRTFRMLINPERSVSEATVQITGLTDELLADKPKFADPGVVDALISFIADAKIVAHNAQFDRGFLNMELERCGRAPYPEDRWIDTLQIAKQRFPGAPASLDALCRRFDISLESRTLHGALLDAQLLADVYLELRGGRARAFDFEPAKTSAAQADRRPARQRPSPLPPQVSEDEAALHAAFIASLGEKSVWRSYD